MKSTRFILKDKQQLNELNFLLYYDFFVDNFVSFGIHSMEENRCPKWIKKKEWV